MELLRRDNALDTVLDEESIRMTIAVGAAIARAFGENSHAYEQWLTNVRQVKTFRSSDKMGTNELAIQALNRLLPLKSD